MDDPASTCALARIKNGYERELLVNRTQHHPNPSKDGSRGYPLWQRTQVLFHLNQYNNYTDAAESIGYSTSSARRWDIRPHPYRMTGGAPRINLCGIDQLLLTICLYIYPHASSDKIAAFIDFNGGGYSHPNISKRCKELDLVRKACSHEAYNTSLPGNMQKAVWFVTLTPPLGVRGLQPNRLLDIDETEIYLSKVNSKYGQGHRACRIHIPSHYTRINPKVCEIMAI